MPILYCYKFVQSNKNCELQCNIMLHFGEVASNFSSKSKLRKKNFDKTGYLLTIRLQILCEETMMFKLVGWQKECSTFYLWMSVLCAPLCK